MNLEKMKEGIIQQYGKEWLEELGEMFCKESSYNNFNPSETFDYKLGKADTLEAVRLEIAEYSGINVKQTDELIKIIEKLQYGQRGK
jgi:hypothetical protein